jgi:galactofuranosylgalactofuranosylrhamnosyl-N-acetylglucosaminyl-diphospho-decaprenol beta-1,5/1,6-galactofuranosyltransferase
VKSPIDGSILRTTLMSETTAPTTEADPGHVRDAASGAPAAGGFRIVQRTVMRADQELDVRSLYLGGVSGFAGGESSSRQSGGGHDEDDDKPEVGASAGEADRGMIGYGRVTSAGEAVVEAERRLTFGTYFNAFPASYWRRWTDFESVRLRVKMRGQGNIVVYRSTSKGHVLRAGSSPVDGTTTQTLEFDLTLKPFIDGGWYWFDIEAGDTELVLEEAVWGVDTDITASGSLTIGITTFNRPDFCVDQLVNLASDQAVLTILDEVLVVDQGTQKVTDDPRYEKAAAALGPKLRVIEQDNLGGSGGFSRAMHEAASKGASDYVLLLDDDVVCELEGVLRAVTFADLAKQTVLVGGQMFSLYDRSVMHAYGETIARYRWFWGPAPQTKHSHDFAKRSLRSTPWLHRRVDVDYNGWWMCLIPTRVIKEIGLAMPMFIKWDDAEFGLRAGSAGYPTVTMPGVAVWHVPWTEKDDTLDWQAYFHERNRLVSGLLHSPYDRGGKLVRESLENHTKRMVSMQYGTAETILLAMSDVLEGPERLHRDMSKRLGEIRALRNNYGDARAEDALDKFPAPRLKKPPRKGRMVVSPTGTLSTARTVAVGLLRQVRPVRELSSEHPESIVPHVDQRWWRLAQLDSALVSSADGTTASWYRRDPREFREQVARSARLHARLYREWPALAARYREALPELTSPEAWKPTFAGEAGLAGDDPATATRS